jgi:integrase
LVGRIRKKNDQLYKQLFRAQGIIDKFKALGRPINMIAFKEEFEPPKPLFVYQAFQDNISYLHERGSYNTARAFEDTMSALRKFKNDESLTFYDIDKSFLDRYEDFERSRDLKDTTISRHMRDLRTLFNKAIEQGRLPQETYPFKKYKISRLNHETRKRALSKEHIEVVKKFVPDPNTKQQLAKDIFLFSYYTFGMNFKDLALLKWSNIVDGKIEYSRAKTKRQFTIPVVQPVADIISFYRSINGCGVYIFPILDESYTDLEKISNRIKSGRKKVNEHLKVIGDEMSLDFELTTYVARHSAATHLRDNEVPIHVISKALGHKNLQTTEVYLADISISELKRAGELLI